MNARRPCYLLLLAAFAGAIFLSGCAGTSGSSSLTPQQQAAVAVVENVALNAALSAAASYAGTGHVNSRQLVSDSLYGGAQQLRTLINTPAAAQPAATGAAIQSGAGTPAYNQLVAAQVQAAVATALQAGAPPDAAVEAAARGLDAGAAKSAR